MRRIPSLPRRSRPAAGPVRSGEPAPDLRRAVWRGDPPVVVAATAVLRQLGLRKAARRLMPPDDA